MNIKFTEDDGRITRADMICNPVEYATMFSALLQYRDDRRNDIVGRTQAAELIRILRKED